MIRGQTFSEMMRVQAQSCEVISRHRPPLDPALESASSSPPQGSIWYPNRVKSANRC